MNALRTLSIFLVFCEIEAAAPVWSNLHNTIEINENIASNTAIYTVKATDSDGDSLNYNQINENSKFRLQSQDVETKFSPDYESGDIQYIILYSVTDGTNTATGTLTVNILDVNEFSPVISTTNIVGNIDENKVIGSTVTISFTVTDGDSNAILYYSLSDKQIWMNRFSVKSTSKDNFHIDSSDGTITTSTTLDRENVATYDDLFLKVTDGTNTATATLTINVNDINDNAPDFAASFYIGSITENAPSGTSVVAVTVDDLDEGTNKVFTLSIDSGDTLSKFNIVDKEIVTTSTAVDYETETTFTLVIKAIDSGSTPLTGTTTVQITVIGENEHTATWNTFSPVWVDATTPFDLSENAPVGTTVVTINANDDDAGTDGEITFELGTITPGPGSGSTAGLFRLDSVTGALSTIGTFDYENSDGISYYDVIVKAKDAGATVKSIERSLRIGLNDFNDNAPAFSSSSYHASLSEADPVGKSIITLDATDADSTFTFSYTIANGNTDDYFELSSSISNQLQLKSIIDLDSPTSAGSTYNLEITVTDGGAPELTGTTYVTITVTSSNENAPTFASVIINETVPETSAIGYTVTSVSASDNDYGEDGNIEYSIVSGNTDSSFRVGSSDGRLTLIKSLDFETSSSYTLKLEAKDNGSPSRATTCTVYITISDANDNKPSCSTVGTVNLSEGVSIGEVVTSLSCSDNDAGTALIYSESKAEFEVDSSGVITTASTIDYDSATQSYTFDVTVSDGSNSILVPITVVVDAVNEFSPTFTAAITETVAEDVAVGTEITTFTAADSDYSPHNIISYSITSVTNSGTGLFSIDTDSGNIRLSQALDFDSLVTKYYEITLIAEDGGGLKGTGTVTVSVTDVNDNTPTCVQSLYVLSIPENTATSSAVVGDLQCTDIDSADNGNLTYTLNQNPGSVFSLVESETAISINVTGSLDFETVSSYNLSVSVVDKGSSPLSTLVSIELKITDINDGGPSFSEQYNVSLAENTAIGTVIQTVAATDPDNANSTYGKLIYSILSGDADNKFAIAPFDGRISLNGQLDYELISEYVLTVKGIEQVGTYSASTYVNITVTDINDNTPECETMSFTVSIEESTAEGTVLQLFNCSDKDSSSFGSLSYTLVSGNLSVFELSSNVLQLKSVIDFESGTDSFDIIVMVSDGTHDINVTGTVVIVDVNEAEPIFSSGTYAVTVPENTTIGTILITVKATDADSSDTLTYSMTSSTTMFSVDLSTGDIRLINNLDRETTQSYSINISVSDGTNSKDATVSFDVADVNDNAPIFNPVSYSGSVSEEDIAGGSVILTVMATDADDQNTDTNALIQYMIFDGDPSGYFQINSSTGDLTTTVQLDFETAVSHFLTIRAFDRNGDSESLYSTAYITVHVVNVNEFNPVFNDTFSAVVDEDIAIGTSVVHIYASDLDLGIDGEISFACTHAKFYIDSESGILFIKDHLDYESLTSYTVEVTVSDQGSTSRSNVTNVTVIVNDINDNDPNCSPTSYSKSIREDATIGSSIASISCSDADSGDNGNMSYIIASINEVNDSTIFSINSSGYVFTATSLDYETVISYTILIYVTDGGGTKRTTSVFINVIVTDVNEHDPLFSLSTYSIYASEASSVGLGIVKVSATDSDTADLVYYFFNASYDAFAVDYVSGEITIKAALDKETTPSYTLIVIALDSGTVDSSRSSSATILINVLDENENPPQFTSSSYIVSLRENVLAGTHVVTINATDMDGESIKYSIVDGNTFNIFALNDTFGIVSLVLELDYENSTGHRLIVKAEDSRNLSSTATIEVNVLSYNEYTPNFIPNFSSVSLSENTTVGTVIITVTATDLDHGNDGVITYSINGSNTFSVESVSGAVKLTAELDKETNDVYVVNILAADGGTLPSYTSTYTLTVLLSDVNDVQPTCSSTAYVISVSENTTVSSNILNVFCNDSDNDPDSLNNKTNFVMVSGNDDAKFSIDSQTGDLTIASLLDRETLDSYSLVVDVVDSGNPALTTTVHIDIKVSDVNDNQPGFENTTYQFTVQENLPLSTVVGKVHAVDPDSGMFGQIAYSILSGNDEAKFSIDHSSGDVKIIEALDAESTTFYNLTVTGSDGGNPILTDTAYIFISVIDVNDNTPVCSQNAISETVFENSTGGDTIVQLMCSDQDSTSSLSYYLIGSVDKFVINSSSGVLTVFNDSLDSEYVSSLTVYINITDQQYSTTVTIFITISDVNEFTPEFSPPGPYNVTISEDFPIAGTIYSIVATDGDFSNDSLVFSIKNGISNDEFIIGSTTGTVQLHKALDAESVGSYIIEIQVTDGTRKSSTNLTITVSNVNDNTPYCDQNIYSISYNESTITGTELLSPLCSDADVDGQSLIFTITSGNSEGKFNINSSSGVLLLNASLDYETTTQYTLLLVVFDTGSPSLSTSSTIVVDVTPVNEEPPVFASIIYETSISEDLSLSSEVITANASDSDTGLKHGSISYFIASGDESGHFSVDDNGKIKLTRSIDRETTDFFNLTLTVFDSETYLTDSYTSTAYISIIVLDINDNYPQFSQNAYSVSIYENAAIGATLLTLMATDDDRDENGANGFTYSIITGNLGDTFNLSDNKLVLAKDIDRESTSLFQLHVRVQDNGTVPLSDNAYVNVEVLAVNEYAPIFSNQSQFITISETIAIGTALYTFSASDVDTGNYGTLRYYIADNATYTEFLLDEYSGVLTVWSVLDYDSSPNEYNISVQVIDTGINESDSRSDYTWIYITLTDENDHTPSFSQNVYTFTINENLTIGSNFGNVLATDEDSGLNGIVTYTVISGDGSTVFAVNESNGELKAISDIDFETKSLFSVVVEAKDNGSASLSSNCLVKLSINDINDNAPLFQPNDFAVTIDENVTVGTIVASMTASDADSAVSNNNVFVYHMISDVFVIDVNTGDITVLSTLDRENISSYILNITATDQGFPQQTGTATLTVLIDDINDNSPNVHGSYYVTFSEDTEINIVVASINATDDDKGVNSELTYTITSGNTDNDFKIDSSLGIIQVAKLLDRERTSEYLLSVDISDGGSIPRTSSINISITISDLNDNGPTFTSTTFVFNVQEDVRVGTEVGIVTATDIDSGQNAEITFSLPIFWSGLNSQLTINESTGAILTSSLLDRETQDSYTILCKISDNGTPKFTSTANITIIVVDVNDNKPTFNASSYSTTVPENEAVGTTLLTVFVTDADIGINQDITLTIDTSSTNGQIASSFVSVNSTSMELTVKQIIDRETTENFSFNLVATDCGTPAKSSFVPITFVVEDLNDNLPEFSSSFFNAEIPYNDNCHVTVTLITATDADKDDTITYNFKSSEHNTFFSLNSTSGLVTVINTLAENSKYVIEVLATDSVLHNNTVKLRIDAFESESTVLTVSMSINKETFDTLEQTFIGELNSIIQQNYSTAQTRRWCIKETSESTVDVSVYFLEDNSTNSESNLANNKSLLIANTVKSILTKSDGSLTLTGGVWDQFNITLISTFIATMPSLAASNDEKWITTTTGIAVLTTICVLVVICTVLTVVLLKMFRAPKIKSPEEKLKEKRKELENVDEKELLETPKIKRQTMATDETDHIDELNVLSKEQSRKGTAFSQRSMLSDAKGKQIMSLFNRSNAVADFIDEIDKTKLPAPVIVRGPIKKIDRKTNYRENSFWSDLGNNHPNAVPLRDTINKQPGFKAKRNQTVEYFDNERNKLVTVELKP